MRQGKQFAMVSMIKSVTLLAMIYTNAMKRRQIPSCSCTNSSVAMVNRSSCSSAEVLKDYTIIAAIKLINDILSTLQIVLLFGRTINDTGT